MSRKWSLGAVIALVVLAAGLGIGLEAGGSTQAPAPLTASATVGSTTTLTDASATQAASDTVNVPTQPTVTVLTTPTTPANLLPGYHKPLIQLGDGNTPEQFILGALYDLALQREGYTVSLTRNIGTPQTALAALKQGILDLFPEYIDQWDSQFAGVNKRFGSLAAAYAAGSRFGDRNGAVLLAPTPFSDTAGIAVTRQYAAANGVTSVADLADGPAVILAAPLEFVNSPQGLPAVERAYGLHPGYVQIIDVGSQYGWLKSGNAQAAYVSTTDPQLLGPEYQLLTDPAGVFGYGNVVPVTTAHVLAAEGPALLATIQRIDAALTTTAMRGLDYEVEVAGRDPTEAASEFLQGQGISPPVLYGPATATTASTTTASTTITATTATPAPSSS